MVNEISAIDNLRFENQLTELTSLYPTDMCPILQETESNHRESVGVIGGYQYGKQSHPTISVEAESRTICSSVRNIKHHFSNNRSNRECQLKETRHL
ncbi:hypothetical protein CR513_16221, partial [Mucuna pruriens]